ncbi:hypothetical protein DY251_06915 [Mesorhizobium denitrificans]|uniref:Uncharacterized protein n=1 Tax=Mesorhizobium denitrificans TaxID=2294114 RepID=A0A371XFL8_9HYPH|nr:hypothetical protein DY251_06915 [Mesorhizobium denitrificans]
MGRREDSMHVGNCINIRVEEGEAQLSVESRTELGPSINAAVQRQLAPEVPTGQILQNQTRHKR